MLYDLSDERVRIENLQRMLRYLSFANNDPSIRVVISGNYDEGTNQSVRSFQQKNNIPVTGITDLETWTKIKEFYDREQRIRKPLLIRPIPNDPNYNTNSGERSDIVIILQAMLGALKDKYDYPTVPISGLYGPQTESAIRIFQKKNGLTSNGIADRETWQYLAEEYNSLYTD